MGVITLAMGLIGFVSVWVKLGSKIGSHEKTLETLEEGIKKHDKDITDLKSATNSIQVDIAYKMGNIEAKLNFIIDRFMEKIKLE
jgi:uncharacterized protein YoxC